MLCFDALIGGTDRNYNNWGILQKADSGKYLRLAPAFDNGISLMWKMKEYRQRFLEGAIDRSFILGAESMFKKETGGKFSLYKVLEELYKIPEYKGTKIAYTLYQRLIGVDVSLIHRVLMQNVCRQKTFQTAGDELEFISEYAKLRLIILKDVLRKLSIEKDGISTLTL